MPYHMDHIISYGPYHMVYMLHTICVAYESYDMYIIFENEEECTNLNSRAPSMSYQFGHQLDQHELK